MIEAAKYFLGCPIWSNKTWTGSLFGRKTRPKEFLAQYAGVLNTVEGNTSFYGIPRAETVQGWLQNTPPTFRFCFKFPRAISHEKRLSQCGDEAARFFDAVAVLGKRLGPFFLQLPPDFGNLSLLERFLLGLPDCFSYAVEVRHPDFYDEGPVEDRFNDLLKGLGIDRVIFDTRNLHSHQTDDPELLNSKRKKPKAPVRFSATAKRPFLRYVGNPDPFRDWLSLKEWAERIAAWIRLGKTPYVFMHHAPDDHKAPQLCRIFHNLVRSALPALPPMAPWPGENEDPEPEQLSLF